MLKHLQLLLIWEWFNFSFTFEGQFCWIYHSLLAVAFFFFPFSTDVLYWLQKAYIKYLINIMFYFKVVAT